LLLKCNLFYFYNNSNENKQVDGASERGMAAKSEREGDTKHLIGR